MRYALGITTVFSLLSRLDRIVVICKTYAELPVRNPIMADTVQDCWERTIISLGSILSTLTDPGSILSALLLDELHVYLYAMHWAHLFLCHKTFLDANPRHSCDHVRILRPFHRGQRGLPVHLRGSLWPKPLKRDGEKSTRETRQVRLGQLRHGHSIHMWCCGVSGAPLGGDSPRRCKTVSFGGGRGPPLGFLFFLGLEKLSGSSALAPSAIGVTYSSRSLASRTQPGEAAKRGEKFSVRKLSYRALGQCGM